MQKLKKKQYGPWCSFCKVNRATHRTKYFAEYFCSNQECKQKASLAEQESEERESHFTEADYQTWAKLPYF
ncbi:hypothetical protein KTH93_11710 [Acinetobacter bereziniae]|uniref:hypothetical protein n=1 Tax=Acinetobacter bereziniae TaxID=106648 RepID=UPI0018FFA1A2|nr:hypothetical protein [Acinetobacter bereziniae]MBJ8476598.1 hypothetical protein [Acinetobacter bereziniae]MCU4436135.1 hypothetical protein [Acinetobacter bereziniae]